MNEPVPENLLGLLARRFPTAKRQTLRRMLADRRVRVNGVVAIRASQAIQSCDDVTIASTSESGAGGRSRASITLLAPLRLVFEDDDLLVVDKPAGLLTSTVPREKRPTALAKVRAYLAATSPDARAGLIHRLDRDASGLLVFSKTREAYQSLKTQFFHHTVERLYSATVRGSITPKKGRIDTHLIERADGRVRIATPTEVAQNKGQRAITDYEAVERSAARSVLRVKLHTGRKHQIRVHLAHRGHPILGDSVYDPRHPHQPRGTVPTLMLRATTLVFDHPRTGIRTTFT